MILQGKDLERTVASDLIITYVSVLVRTFTLETIPDGAVILVIMMVTAHW